MPSEPKKNRIVTPQEMVRDIKAAVDKVADEMCLDAGQKARLAAAVCLSIANQPMGEQPSRAKKKR